MNKLAAITTYDLLKAAALVLMIVDHIGYYFYPDDMGWRIAGRLSAPIWLFLIGYARSRDFSAPLWGGMTLLVFSQFVLGEPLLPLNILATILLIRLTLGSFMTRISQRPESVYPVMALLALFTLATFPFFEYGASAFLPAMLGYWVRRREEGVTPPHPLTECAAVAGVFYFGLQSFVFFAFTPLQAFVAGVGLVCLFIGLTYFRGRVLETNLPSPVAFTLKMAGRHTLFFYVVHLLVFKALAYGFYPERYTPFSFHILSSS